MRPRTLAARRQAHALGLRAETLAALLLRLKGYRVLARRFAAPSGELDLVVRRGRTLVFVEVKARPTLAMAIEAVSPRQRLRIVRGAELFIARHPRLADLDRRFDLVLLAPKRWPRHVMDAFDAGR